MGHLALMAMRECSVHNVASLITGVQKVRKARFERQQGLEAEWKNYGIEELLMNIVVPPRQSSSSQRESDSPRSVPSLVASEASSIPVPEDELEEESDPDEGNFSQVARHAGKLLRRLHGEWREGDLPQLGPWLRNLGSKSELRFKDDEN